MNFFYVYILQSKKIPHRFYIGFTEDLESRLKPHNQGNNPHTSKYKPWRVKTAIAFTDRQRALILVLMRLQVGWVSEDYKYMGGGVYRLIG